MTGEELKSWRGRMKLSAEAAARELGCSKTSVLAWEKRQKVPRYIALACAAYAAGAPPIGSTG
jgi:DNA-binding transcriptional regulator YiaG